MFYEEIYCKESKTKGKITKEEPHRGLYLKLTQNLIIILHTCVCYLSEKENEIILFSCYSIHISDHYFLHLITRLQQTMSK